MIINEDFFDSNDIDITTPEKSVFYEKHEHFGFTMIFCFSYTDLHKKYDLIRSLQKRTEKILDIYVDEFNEPVYVVNTIYSEDTPIDAIYHQELCDYIIKPAGYEITENTDLFLLYHFNVEHMSIKKANNFFNTMKFAQKEYGDLLLANVYVQKFTNYYRVNPDFKNRCQIGCIGSHNLLYIYKICNIFGHCSYADILKALSDITDNSGAEELVTLFTDRKLTFVGKYSLEGFNDNMNGLFKVVRLYSPTNGYMVSNGGPIADVFYTLNTDSIPKDLYNYMTSVPLRIYAQTKNISGSSNIVLYAVFDSSIQCGNKEYIVMANTNYNEFDITDDNQWTDRFMDNATYGCPQLLMNILCGNIADAKKTLLDILKP